MPVFILHTLDKYLNICILMQQQSTIDLFLNVPSGSGLWKKALCHKGLTQVLRPESTQYWWHNTRCSTPAVQFLYS